MSEEKTRVYITVPVSFKDKLKRLADEDKRNVSQYVMHLVEEDEKTKANGEPK